MSTKTKPETPRTFSCDACGKVLPVSQISRVRAYGMDTDACCACRGEDPEDDAPEVTVFELGGFTFDMQDPEDCALLTLCLAALNENDGLSKIEVEGEAA